MFRFPGLPEEMSKGAVKTLQHFINFYYMVSAPALTENNLKEAEKELHQFYSHREVFRKFSASDMKFPKMHGLTKYIRAYRENGAVQNYNSEHSESRHCTDLKQPYRESNRVGYLAQILRNLNHRQSLHWKRRKLMPEQQEEEKLKESAFRIRLGSRQPGRNLQIEKIGDDLPFRGFVRAVRMYILENLTTEKYSR